MMRRRRPRRRRCRCRRQHCCRRRSSPCHRHCRWDPRPHRWIIDVALPSDSPPWPTGLTARRLSDGICGRRGPEGHWKPRQRFPERGRAPISQTIQVETSQYGKRRWLSHDPVNGSWFSSCHRNRVSLHALNVATDGYWPFGFTDPETAQLDRLYDAEAY